jgi:hypothetical protein
MMRVFAPYALHDRTSLNVEFAQKGHAKDTAIDRLSAVRAAAPLDDHLLFSFPHSTVFDGKLMLRSGSDGAWSSGVGIDAVGTTRCLALAPSGNLRLSVGLGVDALADTRVVTVTYQYVVVNQTGFDVWMRAASNGDRDSSDDTGTIVIMFIVSKLILK